MDKISAVIITLNEERNIGRCLASLSEVADEIIVVDSYSEDQTEAICKAKGARFIQTEWQGYSKTKNYANAQATGEYVLSVDADEALSEELKKSILKAKEKGLKGVYEMNRLTNYCGKWIRHCGWYPDKKVRLFPKGKCRWEGDFVHEELLFEKQLIKKHLKGDLLHYSFYSVEDHRQRIEKYARLEAQKRKDDGKKAGWLKLIFSPAFKFVKMYILQLGFLDGYYGFVVCKMSAYANFRRYQLLRGMH